MGQPNGSDGDFALIDFFFFARNGRHDVMLAVVFPRRFSLFASLVLVYFLVFLFFFVRSFVFGLVCFAQMSNSFYGQRLKYILMYHRRFSPCRSTTTE